MMQSVVLRIAVWLFTEVILTAIGTDDIADYGEYVFKVKDLLPTQQFALTEFICANGTCTPTSLNTESMGALMVGTSA